MEATIVSLRKTLTSATRLSGSEVNELKQLRDTLNAILSSSSAEFDEATVIYKGWLSKRKSNLSRAKRRFCILLPDGLHYLDAPFGSELGFIESSDIAEVRWVTQDKRAFVLVTHAATYEITGDVRLNCVCKGRVFLTLASDRTMDRHWPGLGSCKRQSRSDSRWGATTLSRRAFCKRPRKRATRSLAGRSATACLTTTRAGTTIARTACSRDSWS